MTLNLEGIVNYVKDNVAVYTAAGTMIACAGVGFHEGYGGIPPGDNYLPGYLWLGATAAFTGLGLTSNEPKEICSPVTGKIRDIIPPTRSQILMKGSLYGSASAIAAPLVHLLGTSFGSGVNAFFQIANNYVTHSFR